MTSTGNMVKPMCRICLAVDVKMHLIVTTHLQEIYENLNKIPLETQDNRPTQACYICFKRLKNCYQLRQSCVQSEELLTEMLAGSVSNPAKLLKNSSSEQLKVTNPVMQMSLPDEQVAEHCRAWQDQEMCFVKIEPNVAEDDAYEPVNSHDVASPALQNDAPISVIKTELMDVEIKVKIEPPDEIKAEKNMQHSDVEDDLPLDVLKRELSDDTASAHVPVTSSTATQRYLQGTSTNKRNSNDCAEAVDGTKMYSEPSSSYTNAKDTRMKRYQCDVCMKSFNRKCDLSSHIVRMHTSDKPYQCDQCTYSFSRKCDLNVHIRTHTGLKPYQCDKCMKCFTQKGVLDTHLRTVHSDEKPYQCDLCMKRFKHKFTLEGHSRTHTGEKPYQCDVCDKVFGQSVSLKRHSRSHTGEKPYQCNECMKCFARKCYLDAHVLTHIDETPYECDNCKKCFKRKGYYNLHARYCCANSCE